MYSFFYFIIILFFFSCASGEKKTYANSLSNETLFSEPCNKIFNIVKIWLKENLIKIKKENLSDNFSIETEETFLISYNYFENYFSNRVLKDSLIKLHFNFNNQSSECFLTINEDEQINNNSYLDLEPEWKIKSSLNVRAQEIFKFIKKHL